MARRKDAREKEGLVDASTMARLLGVHRVTLYKKAHAGEVPSYRFGRRVLFDPDEVKEALRS